MVDFSISKEILEQVSSVCANKVENLNTDVNVVTNSNVEENYSDVTTFNNCETEITNKLDTETINENTDSNENNKNENFNLLKTVEKLEEEKFLKQLFNFKKD